MWRAKKRGISLKFSDADTITKFPEADMLFAIDVLEHMVDPIECVRKLDRKTRVFAHRSEFNNLAGGRHPFHFNFDERLLDLALTERGFTKVASKYLNVWCREN